jgi:hypothetical protein
MHKACSLTETPPSGASSNCAPMFIKNRKKGIIRVPVTKDIKKDVLAQWFHIS